MKQKKKTAEHAPSLFGSIEDIAKKGVTMHTQEKALAAYEMFRKDMDIGEICVVDDEDYFCGILTRHAILSVFSGMYGYTLHQKYLVSEMMNKHTLVVDAAHSVEQVSRMALKRNAVEIYDAVVVLKDGRYFGIVTIKDLLKTAITIQVKRAAQASPLTGLPGNSTIEQELAGLSQSAGVYTVLYLDLDNFKAYNDAYGFHNGDKMIKTLAEAMKSSCGQTDFLGHVGGDDFVVITRDANAKELAEHIIEKFQSGLKELYHKKDWERGYIVSKNRKGQEEHFAIASVSIAGVTNKEMPGCARDVLSDKLVQAKKEAKRQEGNSVCIFI